MKKSAIKSEIAERRIPSKLGMVKSSLQFLRKTHQNSHPEIKIDYDSYNRVEVAPFEAERRGASAVGAWQRQSFNR